MLIFRGVTLLVGGFNTSEKYARQNRFIFPKVLGDKKTYLKPPTSLDVRYPSPTLHDFLKFTLKHITPNIAIPKMIYTFKSGKSIKAPYMTIDIILLFFNIKHF